MIARPNSPRDSLHCPSVAELSQVLESNATATPHIDQHLETCTECRGLLDYLAGEPQWWEEAASVLATPAPDRPLAPAICAMSSADHSLRNEDPLCEHELKQLQGLIEPASHPELIGRIGRYELEQLVGRGGMGLVFRARDVDLQRVVAVKTLAMHLIPIGAARQRFVREARATALLTHPHIVPVFDVITEGAVPAIVMQFIAGPTLEQQLATAGPMPWRDVLQIGIQLADALAAAHEHGLVHRDIKPGNVLLEAGGTRALLTDFGLVRALDDATLTRSGMLAGTPDYMSPEQANGQTVSTSSDLFSLGSVLYAMLTGHPPFRAESPMAVMNRLCHQRQRPIHEQRSEVPLELTRLVDRLLAKQPGKRFGSAAEVAQHLRELAGARNSLRSQRLYDRFVRKGRPRAIAFALPLVLAACLGLAAWWQRERSDSTLADHQQTASSHLTASPSASKENNALRLEGRAAIPESYEPATGKPASIFLSVAPLDVAELRQLDERIVALSESLVAIDWNAGSSAMEQALEGSKSPAGVDDALSDIRTAIDRLDQELTRSP